MLVGGFFKVLNHLKIKDSLDGCLKDFPQKTGPDSTFSLGKTLAQLKKTPPKLGISSCTW
jgi:hypothetical protein